MGMYDTLNGEQVKCFPWYSFDAMPLAQAGFINGHGGSLAYYGDGSKIPYRSLAYNYSKNFIILILTLMDLPWTIIITGLHM